MEKFCEKLVRYRVPLLILACVVAVAFPFVFPSKYFIRIGTVCLMYVMITLSLNLMVGYMGQMSFGHAAFMGIGAYTAAILTTTYDVPFFVAFILAGVVAGLFGLLLGLPRALVAEFTFFLAIPVMAGASLLKVVKFALSGVAITGAEVAVLVVGCVVAFVVSLATIRFLMDYVKRHNFTVFGVYRILLGLVVLAVAGVQALA